ncbi:SOUL family heme-binding protein [Methanolobus profundi]|uniref:SOUL heme-binding protein n=1 Tax=Methanolobus profundi TaxID=487685 RepID=A0A1I4UQV0_9EURY|nr:heme-binding protein [Methanolobus profundi]SFM91093.1 SOUL heme-binding protein [Methanolobus profundi]
MDKAGAIFALLTVLAVMVGSWFFAGVHVSMVTEEVDHIVLYELGDNTEVRQYGEITVISTTATGQDSGFRVLASYISGNNEGSLKIDMTAPVIISGQGSAINMSFILPVAYNVTNAPVPEDPTILIGTLPSRKLAVIGFSGYVTDEVVEEQRSILSSQLDENNIVTKGDFFLMRYDPPWVPPILMRNEVAIEVE